jgi:hypothetical protein
MELEVQGEASRATIRQTAIFEPAGLAGLLYWYALYPLHQLVFAGMLRGIVAAALCRAEAAGPAVTALSAPQQRLTGSRCLPEKNDENLSARTNTNDRPLPT